MKWVERLPWDSAFFEMPIGRAHLSPDAGVEALRQALAEAEEAGLRCLYLEIPFIDPSLLAFCSAQPRFFLVDIKTTLGLEWPSAPPASEVEPLPEGVTTVLQLRYYDRLLSITTAIAGRSRFAFDPTFGLEGARRLYGEWLRKSFHEGFCSDFLVCLRNGQPAGYLTIRARENAPFIDLFGVAEEERGKGVGKSLLAACEQVVRLRGATRIGVVTQGHNLEALGIYQGRGFRIRRQRLFYHVWR